MLSGITRRLKNVKLSYKPLSSFILIPVTFRRDYNHACIFDDVH
jgi:hypothetical protein